MGLVEVLLARRRFEERGMGRRNLDAGGWSLEKLGGFICLLGVKDMVRTDMRDPGKDVDGRCEWKWS